MFLILVKISCFSCFCCAGSDSEFFSALSIENLDCLGCAEQICGSFGMSYEFTKTQWIRL